MSCTCSTKSLKTSTVRAALWYTTPILSGLLFTIFLPVPFTRLAIYSVLLLLPPLSSISLPASTLPNLLPFGSRDYSSRPLIKLSPSSNHRTPLVSDPIGFSQIFFPKSYTAWCYINQFVFFDKVQRLL